jgi:hypothetical protein
MQFAVSLFKLSPKPLMGQKPMFSRRDFLRTASGAALAVSASSSLASWGAEQPHLAIPGKEESSSFARTVSFDLETPASISIRGSLLRSTSS